MNNSSLNNPFQTKSIIPDYTAGINPGLSFTADEFCEMRVKQTFTSTGSKAVYITINGESTIYDSGGNWGAWNTPFQLKPNDVVELSTTGTSVSAILYPYIGV